MPGLCLVLLVSQAKAIDLSVEKFDGLLLAQSYASSDSNRPDDVVSQYGPVKKKENLWDIAKAFKPPYTTMSQVVMAIYQRNPKAFYKNDINRLKPGAMLEIPSVQEMQATNHRAAKVEIDRQIDAHKTYLEQQQASKVVSVQTDEETGDRALSVEVVDTELETIENIEAELAQESPTEPVPEVEEPASPPPKPAKPERPLFRYSYDISVANDDNIRRAQYDVDIRDDIITSFTLNARGGTPLDSFTILSYGGSVTYESFKTFDELDNIDFNINAKYRFSTSGKFSAPLYSFGAKLGGIESESEMRDSTVVSLSFDVNKWLTTAINMTTGLGFKTRESKSEVFDTEEVRAFVNFDLELSKTALLYGTYSFVTGDIVSSATPRLKIINASEAIEPDDAFGGVAFNQFAYRLDADSHVLTLGYNQIISRSISLDFSYRYIDSESQENDDIYYERNILRASLLGRF